MLGVGRSAVEAARNGGEVQSALVPVGRDAELSAIRMAIAGRGCLVVGSDGSGRTALLRVVSGEQSAPVWVCSLEGVTRPEEASWRILRALAEAGNLPPAVALTERLAALPAGLLVLDDVEGVSRWLGSEIGRWLRSAPHLRLLIAGDSSIHAPGLAVVRLAPLSERDGVALLRSSMRARGVVDEVEELEALRRMVEHAQGSPRILELAAARVARLGTRNAAYRSTEGAPALAALWWAWSLQEPPLLRALHQLGFFRSIFTRQAVRSTLGSSGPELVTRLLAEGLIEPSLGGAGWRLPSAVRDFVRARGLETDLSAQRGRYLDYVSSLTERSGSEGELLEELPRALELLAGACAPRQRLMTAAARCVPARTLQSVLGSP